LNQEVCHTRFKQMLPATAQLVKWTKRKTWWRARNDAMNQAHHTALSANAQLLVQPVICGWDCSRLCLHSKKCWVVWTRIWVKYGQTQMLG